MAIIWKHHAVLSRHQPSRISLKTMWIIVKRITFDSHRWFTRHLLQFSLYRMLMGGHFGTDSLKDWKSSFWPSPSLRYACLSQSKQFSGQNNPTSRFSSENCYRHTGCQLISSSPRYYEFVEDKEVFYLVKSANQYCDVRKCMWSQRFCFQVSFKEKSSYQNNSLECL